jgi:hypothetical protein
MRTLFHIKHKIGLLTLAFVFAVVSTVSPWFGLTDTASAVAPTTPVNVRLLTGGNSVAVLWEPASGSAAATSYKVYRGGVLKATVNPATNNESSGNTQRWLDTTAVNATAYSYTVSAVNVDGESAQTAAKSITHTTSPAVPTVNIDPSTPASLTTFANTVKTFLQAWYPKIVWYLGNPAGTSTTINLKPVAGLENTAQQVGNTIEYRQEWAIANATSPTAPNLFIHETTHLAQLSGTGTNYLPWAHEGMADYMREHVFGDSNTHTVPMGDKNGTWLRGYDFSSYLFKYISTTYNKPNFVKDLDASFTPGYDINFIKNQTGGLTVAEVWQKMGGRRVSSPTFFKNVNASFKCLELTGQFFNPPDFAAPKLAASCNNGGTAQQWEYIADDATGTSTDSAINTQGEIRVLTIPNTGTCLDVYGSGVTAGTRVYTYPCNGSIAQKWQIVNGTLKNPNSGMCLQPIAKGTAAGTGMEIAACDGTTSQDWFVRPIGILKNQSGTLCASISVLTPVQLYGCGAGIPNQQFQYIQPTAGASSGQLKNAKGNVCLQPVGASIAVDANMEFVACASGNIQQWQWQSDLKVKNIGSGLCLTLPAAASPWQLTQTSCTVEASPASLKKWDPLYQY